MFYLRKTKKGDAGQVFVYILTVLIMGLMLYFGVKWIIGLMSTTGEIEVAQLKIDLETSFEKIRPNTRSWQNVVFNVPEGLKKVCFVDSSYSLADKKNSGLCQPATPANLDYNPIMCNAWKSNNDENIMFDPPVDKAIYIKDIKVDSSSGYKCFLVENNKFRVKLTGLGVGVRVS
jgi:hypothetical protein